MTTTNNNLRTAMENEFGYHAVAFKNENECSIAMTFEMDGGETFKTMEANPSEFFSQRLNMEVTAELSRMSFHGNTYTITTK